jgi:hypothetical protein
VFAISQKGLWREDKEVSVLHVGGKPQRKNPRKTFR